MSPMSEASCDFCSHQLLLLSKKIIKSRAQGFEIFSASKNQPPEASRSACDWVQEVLSSQPPAERAPSAPRCTSDHLTAGMSDPEDVAKETSPPAPPEIPATPPTPTTPSSRARRPGHRPPFRFGLQECHSRARPRSPGRFLDLFGLGDFGWSFQVSWGFLGLFL